MVLLLLLADLQIIVLTMKLPETDFVLVIDRAARRNTFDFFTDSVLFSLRVDCSSTLEVFALTPKFTSGDGSLFDVILDLNTFITMVAP